MKKIKAFSPVQITQAEINKIADGLKSYFKTEIFDTIFEILSDKNIVFNAKMTILLEAIRLGNVWYKDGAFRTKARFSNAISKELESLGAVFKNGAYYINQAALPFEIEQAISLVAIRDAAKLGTIQAFLNTLANTIEERIKKLFIENVVTDVFTRFQNKLVESTSSGKVPVIEVNAPIEKKNVPDDVYKNITRYWKETDNKADKLHRIWEEKKKAAEKDPGNAGKQLEAEKARQNLKTFRELQQAVAPTIDFKDKATDETARKVSEDYVYNMKFWIKKWEAKEITIMRAEVLKMVKRGARRQEVEEYFKNRWGIAQRKAEFLARNECGLASSTIKAVHYQQMGCKYFLWLKSVSKEKRPEHLELAKKVNNQFGIGGTNLFKFSDPPVIDFKTGQRGLPKQIYNCKCDFIGVYNPEFYYRKYESEQNFIKRVTNAIKTYCEQRTYPIWKYKKFEW